MTAAVAEKILYVISHPDTPPPAAATQELRKAIEQVIFSSVPLIENREATMAMLNAKLLAALSPLLAAKDAEWQTCNDVLQGKAYKAEAETAALRQRVAELAQDCERYHMLWNTCEKDKLDVIKLAHGWQDERNTALNRITALKSALAASEARVRELEKDIRFQKEVSVGLGRLVNDKDADRLTLRARNAELEADAARWRDQLEGLYSAAYFHGFRGPVVERTKEMLADSAKGATT